MAVKIKLKRMGKIRQPQYRIVIADARTKRDGRAIEEIGVYHPKEEPSLIQVSTERVQYWLSVGAQPTETVLSILKVTGDWQKFKGLPGAEGTLRVKAPKADKLETFNKVLAETHNEPVAEATTPKKSRAKKTDAPAADVTADAAVAETAPEVAPVVEDAPVAEVAAEVPDAPVADAAAEAAADAVEQA